MRGIGRLSVAGTAVSQAVALLCAQGMGASRTQPRWMTGDGKRKGGRKSQEKRRERPAALKFCLLTLKKLVYLEALLYM